MVVVNTMLSKAVNEREAEIATLNGTPTKRGVNGRGEAMTTPTGPALTLGHDEGQI